MVQLNDSKIAFVEKILAKTKAFALTAISLYKKLPATEESKIIGRQFLRSATSAGANYRAACRARSKAEFFAKLSITIEEADESIYWLELLEESGTISNSETKYLIKEANEITAILATARKNTYS
ncbi:MAG: four helix bundle protein [Sphingobacteriales bacterium]|nr:MAG: four helix bundle protein [Sphingobacteriales bacterium]